MLNVQCCLSSLKELVCEIEVLEKVSYQSNVAPKSTGLVFLSLKFSVNHFCVLTSFVPVSSQSKLDVEHSKELAKAKYVDQPIYIEKSSFTNAII